jgi:hypothetical protein
LLLRASRGPLLAAGPCALDLCGRFESICGTSRGFQFFCCPFQEFLLLKRKRIRSKV